MYSIPLQQKLMHVLQALALSAEAQRVYVANWPIGMISEYRHWLHILQGRSDWKPTQRQQLCLISLHELLEEIKSPEITFLAAESWTEHDDRQNRVAREELDNDAWGAVRKSSRETLTAFRWKHVAPPEDDLKRYERLGDATVSEIPFRLKVAIAELNVVRLRPGMFFLGGIDGVTNYLCGYSNAILELVPSSKRFMDYVVSAYTERGWKPNNIATEPIPQMKKLGWSDDAMIDEVICIHIDALSQLFIDEGLWKDDEAIC